MLYACILFLLFGTLFGNLNAIAMEPMGHVAGMASAIIGAASSVLSLILASIIGQLYNGTTNSNDLRFCHFMWFSIYDDSI